MPNLYFNTVRTAKNGARTARTARTLLTQVDWDPTPSTLVMHMRGNLTS